VGNYKSEKMLLLHNLQGGGAEVKRIYKLINMARELGGTIYDMAAASGLLSAYRFMELHLDKEAANEKKLSEDMAVVTEAYIRFPGIKEFDRVFLYSENALRDAELEKEGYIQDGKFIIEYDKLKALHAKGYHCVFGKPANQTYGKKCYEECFGREQQLLYVKKWDEDTAFIGNGFNRALLVRTPFETVFVMPDIYAVQMSIRTYFAECMIRESGTTDFCIERIDVADEAAMEVLDETWSDIFGNGKVEEDVTLPESYAKLIYQIAYVRAHYPFVYYRVWSERFEDEDEICSVNFAMEHADLGISLDYSASYGVCRMSDGTIKRVPNMTMPAELPLCQKYKFAGYETTLKNAGTAGSRIALVMQKIRESAELFLGVTIENVYITCREELPKQLEIGDYMEQYRENAGIEGNIQSDANLIAYEQIAKQYMDGREVLQWAAELAKLPEMRYVDRTKALLKTCEQVDGAALDKDEIALLYEFDENTLCMTLIRKDEQGEIEIIAQEEEVCPEENMAEEELMPGVENPNLMTVLGNEMQEFMLDEGLRAIGIIGTNDRDRKAYDELKGSAVSIKRQFKRNDNAKLYFNNGYFCMSVDYPIEKFETCFEPILKRNEEHLRRMLKEAAVDRKEIAKVYLAGSECEYPFVRKSIESFLQKRGCCVRMPECAEANGIFLD